METENVKREPGPGRPRGAKKLSRRLMKLAGTALDALEGIMTDESAKSADRIAAAKLTFDLLSKELGEFAPEDGTVRVVFEGEGKEWAG